MSSGSEIPEGRVRVRYVKCPTEEDIRFIIAKFPSVMPKPISREINVDCYYDPKCRDESQNKIILVAKSEKETLVGSTVNSDEGKCYFQKKVAILDEEKGEVVLYDAHFFDMEFVDEGFREKFKLNTEEDEATKKRLQKETLVKSFGSKMSRKLVEAKARNTLDHKTVKETMDSLKMDEEIADTLKVDSVVNDEDAGGKMAKYLPTFVQDATDPRLAYPLNGLISDNEMEAMLNPAKEFIEADMNKITEWFTNKTHCIFVCTRLKRLPDEMNARKHLSKLLMYLDYLLHLYSLKPAALRKRDILPKTYPHVVKSKLIEKFTTPIVNEQFGRSMSSNLRDSLLFHIIVLCLHIEDFNMHIAELNNDIPGKDLVKYFRLLGCKVKVLKDDGNHTKNNAKAVLKVPLVFPDIERHSRKRKAN